MIGDDREGAAPRGVLAAPGIYFTGDDHLLLTSWNSLAGVVLTLTGRFLHLDGRIEPFRETHTPNTDRTAGTSTFRRAEGWLLECSVLVSTGAPVRGQTFVRVDLVRGLGVVDTVLAPLFADYVTSAHRPGYPFTGVRSPLEGPGALRSVLGTNPAAAAEISETVPTGARWTLYGATFVFVTDGNAANREVAIVLTDGTNILATSSAGFSNTASLTKRYVAAPYGAGTAPLQGTDRQIVLPPFRLLAGWKITTVTTNIQAGDDYAAPRLTIEEHLEAA